jgi:hypothetical protein
VTTQAVTPATQPPNYLPPDVYPTGANPIGLQNADFNKDGKTDLVVLSADASSLSVYLGNGDGTFAGPATYATPPHPSALAIGDFNGDGFPDVAVASSNPNGVTIFQNKGDGTFAPVAPASPATRRVIRAGRLGPRPRATDTFLPVTFPTDGPPLSFTAVPLGGGSSQDGVIVLYASSGHPVVIKGFGLGKNPFEGTITPPVALDPNQPVWLAAPPQGSVVPVAFFLAGTGLAGGRLIVAFVMQAGQIALRYLSAVADVVAHPRAILTPGGTEQLLFSYGNVLAGCNVGASGLTNCIGLNLGSPVAGFNANPLIGSSRPAIGYATQDGFGDVSDFIEPSTGPQPTPTLPPTTIKFGLSSDAPATGVVVGNFSGSGPGDFAVIRRNTGVIYVFPSGADPDSPTLNKPFSATASGPNSASIRFAGGDLPSSTVALGVQGSSSLALKLSDGTPVTGWTLQQTNQGALVITMNDANALQSGTSYVLDATFPGAVPNPLTVPVGYGGNLSKLLSVPVATPDMICKVTATDRVNGTITLSISRLDNDPVGSLKFRSVAHHTLRSDNFPGAWHGTMGADGNPGLEGSYPDASLTSSNSPATATLSEESSRNPSLASVRVVTNESAESDPSTPGDPVRLEGVDCTP